MKRFCNVFLLLCALAISACGTLSKNSTIKGRLVLARGVAGSQEINANLVFERYSWYSEVTMLFDLLMTEIDGKSPFAVWLSPHELGLVNGCGHFYSVVSMAADSDRISEKDFIRQLEKQGFQEILLPQFSANIKAHPEFERLGLNRHHVYGLCQKAPTATKNVNFPGYKTVTLQ